MKRLTLFALLLFPLASVAQGVLTNMDDTPGLATPGWQSACVGPSCAGGVGTPSSWNQTFVNASPSLDGNSMMMTETGTNYSNVMFHYSIGADNAATTFTGTYNVNIPSLTPYQVFGMDMYQYIPGVRLMWGSQCAVAGATAGFWSFFDQQPAPNGTWYVSTVPCPLTSATNYKISMTVHRVPGDTSCVGGIPAEHYDSLTQNGTTYPLNLTYCSETTLFANDTGMQFDISSNSVGGTLTAYVDQMTYVASLGGPGQSYNARTDLVAQPYPGSSPCPGPSCGTFGTFTGANFQFTPSDFPTTPFIRITDNSTSATNHQGFIVNCDDSSEGNGFNMLGNRFVLCQKGNIQTIFSWNGTTATQIASGTWGLANSFTGGQAFYSYTQPYALYHSHPCQAGITGCTQHDLTIFQADTSGGGNPPTPTVVVDLNAACGLPNYASPAFEDGVTVSRDDQSFSFNVCNSGTCIQGSAGNVITGVWNRTNGCSYLNTSTWQVFNNGVLLGTAGGTPQNFVMHNARITQDGSLLRINKGTCTSCVSGQNWLLWKPFTTTIVANTDLNGCGHLVNGYLHIANKCQGPININGLGYYPFSSINTWTSLPAAYPASSDANEAHPNWSNDNLTDTNPFFVSFDWPGSFAANFAWDSELVGVSTDGSGKVYRFAHNYATPTPSAFVPINASQDGKSLLLSTDWDQMLGCSNGTTLGCGPNQPDWVGTHVYAANALVTPVDITKNAGGYSYQTVGGTSGGSQPSPWNQTVGGTSSDGTLTWTNVGLYRSDVFLLQLPLPSQIGVSISSGVKVSGGVIIQ